MRNFLLFLAGVVFGALLMNSPAASAANALMFGKFGTATLPVQVDTNGYVKVVLN